MVAIDLQVSPIQYEIASAGLPDCVVNDPQNVGDILNVLDQRPLYAIDVETTGLNYKRSSIHGISIAVDDHEWYIMDNAITPFMEGLNDLHFHHSKLGAIGHHLKFDLHFLKQFGYRPKHIADTMIGQYLVNENMELGLKVLAETRLGIVGLPDFGDLLKDAAKRLKKKKDDVNIYDIPLEIVAPYSAKDTRLTFDLWKVISKDLKQEGLWSFFFDNQMPFLYTLLDMEENGMYVDQEKVAVLADECRIEAEKARADFVRLAGNVNPNSSVQMRKLLFETLKLPVQDKTKSGAPSTDALTLQRLAPLDKTGTVAAVQSMRMYEKLLNTYLIPFQTLPWTDGRIYTTFNQDGAVTGRLSCEKPNLQNIPARTDLGHKFRETFCAQSEDTCIVVADYSQLELRLASHFSNELKMLKVFWEGGDPHQATADLMGIERYVAKTVNFGNLYGQGPRTLCNTIEETGKPRPTEAEAKRWLKAFEDTYTDMVKWKKGQVQFAREHGYVKTILGRKRHIPDITSYDNYLRSRAERQSFNAPIQGSAADVASVAMNDLAPYCGWYGAKMILQVHDEIVFEVPKIAAEDFSHIVQEKMEGVSDTFGLRARLQAGPGIGHSWSEAKENGK